MKFLSQIRSASTSQPRRAGSNVVLAELGSLSLEFTRLAQITKEEKYYDAVARITNELEKMQNTTKLPGMWPVSVDASGCKKPDFEFTRPYPQHPPLQILPTPSASATQSSDLGETSINGETRNKPDANLGGQGTPPAEKRQLQHEVPRQDTNSARSAITGASIEGDSECQPQGLASPSKSSPESFTLGGMSDSVYEYLPKEYMLLGGLNDQYRSMFEQSLDVVKKHLLFQPMTPTERNVLVSGSVTSKGHPETPDNIKFTPEGQHLTCFAGGMFAIGARIFNRPGDLAIAAKLADGCVWSYESTATGIMPEKFTIVPCPRKEDCPWNETLYMESLDPYRANRDRQREQQEQSILAQKESEARVDDKDMVNATSMPKLPEAATVIDRVTQESNHPYVKRQLEDTNSVSPAKGNPLARDADGLGQPPPDKQSKADQLTISDANPSAKQDDDTTDAAISAANISSTLAPAYTPPPIPTHEEFVADRIATERLPKGFTSILSKKYILRPEAIESVFIMYRTTGDEYWREKGWQMFTAIQKYTRVEFGNSAISDVTTTEPSHVDEMESFWLAETLKYFYLLFSDPGVVSLDDYVL